MAGLPCFHTFSTESPESRCQPVGGLRPLPRSVPGHRAPKMGVRRGCGLVELKAALVGHAVT